MSWVDNFMVTFLPSNIKVFFCRFGLQTFLVFFCENGTLCPNCFPFGLVPKSCDDILISFRGPIVSGFTSVVNGRRNQPALL